MTDLFTLQLVLLVIILDFTEKLSRKFDPTALPKIKIEASFTSRNLQPTHFGHNENLSSSFVPQEFFM